MGYWPTLSGGEQKLPALPPLVWTMLTVLVVPLTAWLFVLLCRAVGHVRQSAQEGEPGTLVVALCSLLLLALTISSPYYHDTLALALLPGLTVFLLSQVRGRVVRPALAQLVLAVFVAISLVSMHEFGNWHSAAWRAGQALLSAGVPITRISGGNEWNYWYLWEDYVRQARASGQPISFGVKQITPDYVLSFSPQIHGIVDAPFPVGGPAYRVCAQTPYERPLVGTPGFVYTLGRGQCASSGGGAADQRAVSRGSRGALSGTREGPTRARGGSGAWARRARRGSAPTPDTRPRSG